MELLRIVVSLTVVTSMAEKTPGAISPLFRSLEPFAEQAVVILATSLNHCILGRMLTVAKTAPTMDTWAVVSKIQYLEPYTPHMFLFDDQREIRFLVADQNDFIENSTSGSWKSFQGSSRYAKVATIQFISTSPYAYVWHIEDDVFFTGKWGHFFNQWTNDNSDVISKETRVSTLQWAKSCIIDGRHCEEDGEYVEEWLWPTLRLSKRIAVAIRGLLDGERAHGHHEAILPRACEITKCVHSNIFPQGKLGGVLQMDHAGIPPWKQTLERAANSIVRADHVYHPVKCLADFDALAEKQMNWSDAHPLLMT